MKIQPTTHEMKVTADDNRRRRRRARNLNNHPVECKRRRVKFSRYWNQLVDGTWVYRG